MVFNASRTAIISASLIILGALGSQWNVAASSKPVLEGNVAQERVDQLISQIDWHHNLHKAEREAQQQGKLIFWMHMLGHIDGCT